ncbi:MAG: sterol desaturase family protein [Proteobacteria bacterium]|nr:sterol desaturase family protein [Pseudomonadota bacterium]
MTNETFIRLGVFLLAFLVFASWESLAPRRPLNCVRSRRWLANVGLSLINQLALRLFFPVLAVALAAFVQQRGWGLFNILKVPDTLAVLVCFLLLDLAIYVQHIVFHRIESLWRLHRVHHTDLDFDVTTAIRFHPVEIILSMLIKMVLVVLLGAPPLAVLIFEVVLNLTALFNHSNIHIPLPLDRVLRWGVVTPDMHRVHHSAVPVETDSNFGFNLPWWDYLFKTYRAQPEKGHTEMIVGLHEFRNEQKLALPDLLLLPFRRP